MNYEPQLLLQWEPRWQTFLSNIKPALQYTPGRLQVEYSKPRFHSMATSAALHVAVVSLVFSIFTSGWLNGRELRVRPPDFSHVVYYRASELPQISDQGGAQEGLSGKSGGREAYHPTQTIRISRGPKLVDRVVDAPHLNLPKTNDPVANLLALGGPVAPSAPTESLRRSPSQSLLNQAAMPVEPAPSNPSRDVALAPKLLLPANLVHPAPRNLSRSIAQARLGVPMSVVQPAAENTSRNLAQANLGTMPMGIVQPAPENVARSVMEARLAAPVGVVQPSAENVSRNVSQFGALPGPAHPGVAPSQGVPGGTGKAAESSGSGGSGTRQATAGSGGNGSGRGAGAAGPSSKAMGQSGAGGNGGPMGVIVSLHPGEEMGMTPEPILGSLAMSPSGGLTGGLGGSGGGTGIGKGTGPGSGTSGSGPGGGKAGAGLGSDPLAKGGTSLAPGPGGTGNGAGGPTAGITVRGNTVGIPGFAAASASGLDALANLPLGPRKTPPIIIVASPRSGGAVNRYGLLKGNKVYTIYLDTDLGMAVVQYADHSAGSFHEELTAPELQHSEYPAGITGKLRLVVSCLIDPTGGLKDLHILETSNSEVAAKMVSALSKWRFRPVLRGDKAVEAQAIVGFGVDTR